MTHPIYWTDPTKSDFIVSIDEVTESDDGYKIAIDMDIARPAGGGQESDRGWILAEGEKARFHSVVVEDGRTFLVSDRFLKKGGKANVLIDMSWRMGMMQNHTAEHLFMSEVLRKRPDLSLGKIWIDGEQGTVEIESGEISLEEALEIEKRVNDAIEATLAVKTSFVSASEFPEEIRAREGVHEKEEIRIVEIGTYDKSACSGIHVTNTSQIVSFKIVDFKQIKNGVHVTFLTGRKSWERTSQLFNVVLSKKDDFPFEEEQLGDILEKCKRNQSERSKLQDTLEDILTKGWTSEVIGEVTLESVFLAGLDGKRLRGVIQKLTAEHVVVRLLFIPGSKANLVVWTNEFPVTASQLVGDIIVELGGRGGGSDRVYTGGFSNVDDPTHLFEQLLKKLKNRIEEFTSVEKSS
jgi:alanyl-tRNA synthetase